jgi:hypothetical protein
MSQQTVGLSAIGIAAIATKGLQFAKNLIDKRKEKVAAGTKKPLFKPGGVFDKIKTKIQGGAMQTKGVNLPDEPIGANVQLPGGQFNVGFNPSEQQPGSQTFFSKYKTPLLIGGGLLAVGAIYMITKKKKRR